jgi:hypothetical protein
MPDRNERPVSDEDEAFANIVAGLRGQQPMRPLSDVGLLEEEENINRIGMVIISVLRESGGSAELGALLSQTSERAGVGNDDVRVALARLTGGQVAPGIGASVSLSNDQA